MMTAWNELNPYFVSVIETAKESVKDLLRNNATQNGGPIPGNNTRNIFAITSLFCLKINYEINNEFLGEEGVILKSFLESFDASIVSTFQNEIISNDYIEFSGIKDIYNNNIVVNKDEYETFCGEYDRRLKLDEFSENFIKNSTRRFTEILFEHYADTSKGLNYYQGLIAQAFVQDLASKLNEEFGRKGKFEAMECIPFFKENEHFLMTGASNSPAKVFRKIFGTNKDQNLELEF